MKPSSNPETIRVNVRVPYGTATRGRMKRPGSEGRVEGRREPSQRAQTGRYGGALAVIRRLLSRRMQSERRLS